MAAYAAIILAGGAGRRLGAADKPQLIVGGRPLLDRVLAAVADARPRIVVGPPRELPAGVLTTREDPPGGGPVAALAAGIALVPDGTEQVAVLAADLPFLTADAVAALREAAATHTAIASPATAPTLPPDRGPTPGPVPSERGPTAASPPSEQGRTAGSPRRRPTGSRPSEPGPAPGPLPGRSGPEAAVYSDGGRRQLLCAVWRLGPLRGRLAALGDPAGLALRRLYADATVTEITSHEQPPPWYDCDTEADLRRAEAWLEGDA